MKATLATSMLVLMLSMAAPPVLADDDIKDLVSGETLAAFCATVPLDTETPATLTGLDGSTVTGTIECEAEDLVVGDDDLLEADELDDVEDEDSDEGDDDSEDDAEDSGDASGEGDDA